MLRWWRTRTTLSDGTSVRQTNVWRRRGVAFIKQVSGFDAVHGKAERHNPDVSISDTRRPKYHHLRT